MILYLDTSALVKKYIEESYSFLPVYDERLRQAAQAEGLNTMPQ